MKKKINRDLDVKEKKGEQQKFELSTVKKIKPPTLEVCRTSVKSMSSAKKQMLTSFDSQQRSR